MARLETPPDVNSLEIFDLTTPRGESEVRRPWRAGMVELEEEEVFYDIEEHYEVEDAYVECVEPAVQVPENVAIVAMDLQDEEDVMVKMVRVQKIGCEEECMVTLDSGASVLPRCYAGTGERQQEKEELRMVDAQGRKIAHEGITRARVRVRDKTGKEIELVEEFVLGNVQHPILCAGKLLKRGWSLSSVDGSLRLRHETREVDIPLNTSRNSLQFEAQILMVKLNEEVEMQDEKLKNLKEDDSDEKRVFALTGYLSRYVKDLEMTPGWHRLPNGVAVYSDPVAMKLIDPSDSVEKMYKARVTMVKGKDGMWTQLENIETTRLWEHSEGSV